MRRETDVEFTNRLNPAYCRLAPGQVLVATSGEYSSTVIIGVFRAVADLDLLAEAAAFAAGAERDRRDDSAFGLGFWSGLVARGLLVEEAPRYFNLNDDYGKRVVLEGEAMVPGESELASLNA